MITLGGPGPTHPGPTHPGPSHPPSPPSPPRFIGFLRPTHLGPWFSWRDGYLVVEPLPEKELVKR